MDNRELVIPGYGKSSALQKKLNVIEAPKPKVQPKVTGVPDGLKDLFSSEADLQRILMMNKQKKKLKALAKEEERARRSAQATIASVSSDPFEKTLEDEGYNPTKKKQESESEEEQPKT
jgi:vacuolar-type H+-ATPase subunit I/STV1